MIRILLFVMLAALLLTTPSPTARVPAPEHASDNSASETHATGTRTGSSTLDAGSRAPAHETRARSGSPASVPGGRPGLRWHSFLPGMFR